MTIREETIKEILGKTITKVIFRPTQTSIEKMRNVLAKIGVSIKTTHTMFPEGTKCGYAAAIIIALEYWKQVT